MDLPAPRTIRSSDVASDVSQHNFKQGQEVPGEGNLLIEAVSLLVQRQRETEGWVAEQVWQAEERAAAAERRYAELEGRLAGIEEHLTRLVHAVEPTPGDPAVDERLSRLREQVDGLKMDADSRMGSPGARPNAAFVAAPPVPLADQPNATPQREPEVSRPAPLAAEPQVRYTPEPGVRYVAAPSHPSAPEPPVRYAPVAEPQSAPARGLRYATAPTPEPPAERVVVGPAPARVATASNRVGFLDLLGSNAQDRWGLVLIGVGAVAVLYVLLSSLRFA